MKTELEFIAGKPTKCSHAGLHPLNKNKTNKNESLNLWGGVCCFSSTLFSVLHFFTAHIPNLLIENLFVVVI